MSSFFHIRSQSGKTKQLSRFRLVSWLSAELENDVKLYIDGKKFKYDYELSIDTPKNTYNLTAGILLHLLEANKELISMLYNKECRDGLNNEIH